MGAVSGDVNSQGMFCTTVADLSSRATAGMRSGDRAYVVSAENTAEGPRFYLDKTSIATVGVGVINTDSLVGRWLSEALFASGSGDLTVFSELAADTLVGVAANPNFFSSTPFVAPADGFIEVFVYASLDSGANAANVAFAASIQPAATALGGFGVGSGAASSVSSGGMVKRAAVVSGQSVTIRIATTPSMDLADINAATLPNSQGLQILVKFTRS